MLGFGTSEQKFLREVYNCLRQIFHIVGTTTRMKYVYGGEESDRVIQKKLCPVVAVDQNRILFVDGLGYWCLSFRYSEGVWYFRQGECSDPEIILQTVERCRIIEGSRKVIQRLYDRIEASLTYLEELLDQLEQVENERVTQGLGDNLVAGLVA